MSDRLSYKRRLLLCGQLGVVLLMGWLSLFNQTAMPPLVVNKAEASEGIVYLHYQIDRSRVPDWVTFRDLTLRIQVGDADRVSAWGDGEPLAVQRMGQADSVTVTTSASELTLALQGQNLGAPDVGEYTKATLKDDKLWAFSLTFDDGQLSAYEYAYPELRRYGYRAAVAVIGWWLDRDDAVYWEYCGKEELRELLAAGWSMFNHSYHHSAAPTDITFEEAWLCQDAMTRELGGYRATVFTAPHVSSLWQTLIESRGDELGLYLLQGMSEYGGAIQSVDNPILLTGAPYHLGRSDIKNWAGNGYSYFQEAHDLGTGTNRQHSWISLHAHNAKYAYDWCAITDAVSYLYHTYGAGGTDEVWVAPADEVFQYLVVRSYATIQRGDGPAQGLGVAAPTQQRVSYQQGMAGYSGWSDTYIQAWYPGTNFAANPQLLLRSPESGRSAVLLKVNLVPPNERAAIVEAKLGLYALTYTNDGGQDISIYPLVRPWQAAEATWQGALSGVSWGVPGARGVGVDRSDKASDVLHQGGCGYEPRWYVFDVTDLAREWLAQPERNHGVILESSDGISKGIYFASSEYSLAGLRPVLSVVYAWTVPGSIRGWTWEDSDGNGAWDRAEPPLGDVVVELLDSGGSLRGRRSSESGGEFLFADLEPGQYTVVQAPVPGHVATTATSLAVAVSSRFESQVAFGNHPVYNGELRPRVYVPNIVVR